MAGSARPAALSVGAGRRRLPRSLRRLLSSPAGVAGCVALVAVLGAALLARHVAPELWDSIDLAHVDQPPTLHHLFGTDQVGRDVLSRTLWGLQTTVEIGLAAAGIATAVGVTVGVTAGYYGGWLDVALMRLVDLVASFPTLMLSLAAIILFTPVWPHTLILVLGLSTWTIPARVVRGVAASTTATDYVEAARAVGASDVHILRRHVLPNVAGIVLVAATSVLGQALLLEATIEFFSYGLPASRWPALGNLLADVSNSGALGLSGYRWLGWWTWAFPAGALALLLSCVNVVGDALDEALDPLR